MNEQVLRDLIRGLQEQEKPKKESLAFLEEHRAEYNFVDDFLQRVEDRNRIIVYRNDKNGKRFCFGKGATLNFDKSDFGLWDVGIIVFWEAILYIFIELICSNIWVDIRFYIGVWIVANLLVVFRFFYDNRK